MAPSKSLPALLFVFAVVLAATLQPSEAIRSVKPAVAAAVEEASGHPAAAAASANGGVKPSTCPPLPPIPGLPVNPPQSGGSLPIPPPAISSPPPPLLVSPPPPPPPPPSQPTECLSSLIGLMPCMGYLTNTTVLTPPTMCCDGFKSLVSTAPICLCHGLNGDLNKLMPATMDFLKMMTLPVLCNVPLPILTLLQCATSTVPPMMPPTPTPAEPST